MMSTERASGAAAELQVRGSEYLEWLATTAGPTWWSKGAAQPDRGFHDALNAAGEPVGDRRRARVQTRQVFVYANAARLGWSGPWVEAAHHGMRFFLAHHRRADGLFATLVAADGRMIDDAAELYDQAFALLALASLHRVAPESALRPAEEGLALLEAVQAMRHPQRGFLEAAPHRYQANAQMHMLEASLAWEEASGDPRFAATADELVALALDRFIDREKGFLREFFDETWRPEADISGGLVEPGHQFEWAWLLSKWRRLRGVADADKAIADLLETGRLGVRPDGVTIDQLSGDGSVRSDRARLWPQTERLRMMIARARVAAPDDREVWEREAVSALAALTRYLDTPARGLWRDKLLPDGSFVDEPAPASSLYHLMGAGLELDAWLAEQRAGAEFVAS